MQVRHALHSDVLLPYSIDRGYPDVFDFRFSVNLFPTQMKNKNKTFKNKKGFCYLLYFACQLAGGCGMSKTKKIKAFLVCGFQHPDYSKRQTRTSTLRLTVNVDVPQYLSKKMQLQVR